MPRVRIKKKEYMAKDIGSWIAVQMRKKKVTQTRIARELGISQQAFAQKLSTGHLTYIDLLVVMHELDASDEEIVKLMKY